MGRWSTVPLVARWRWLGETVIEVLEGDLSNLSIVTTGPSPGDTVIQMDSGALFS